MGLRNEDFAWVPRERLAALVAVAYAARKLCRSDVISEADWDELSDVLFTLDRGGEGWASPSTPTRRAR